MTTNKRRSLFDTSEVVIDLNPQIVSSVEHQVAKVPTPSSGFDLLTVPEDQVVMYGIEVQQQANGVLDKLLAEVSKGNNPVLFEIFTKIERGVDDVDLGELEKEIRESQGKSGVHKLLDSVGLSSVAKRMQKAQERIGLMLTSKSATLSDLVKSMEQKVAVEVTKLTADAKSLNVLSEEFRRQVGEYTVLVSDGKLILQKGKDDLLQLTSNANASGDPLKMEEARIFEQKVNLFENRLLVLETCLGKAPVELETLRISQGAIWQTTSEVATSAMAEFADIKSSLIKLAVSYQLGSVQGMSEQRRKLKDKMGSYSNDLLEKTAVSAANAQGNHRLEDATKLLETANRVAGIRMKLDQANKDNAVKFEESRKSLEKVKTLIH